MTPRGRQRAQPSRTLREVLARKRELIERSDIHRRALAEHVAGLGPVFAAGDRVAGYGRSLLARPWLLAGIGVALLVIMPRRILGLATRGFALWSGARGLRRGLSAWVG